MEGNKTRGWRKSSPFDYVHIHTIQMVTDVVCFYFVFFFFSRGVPKEYGNLLTSVQ